MLFELGGLNLIFRVLNTFMVNMLHFTLCSCNFVSDSEAISHAWCKLKLGKSLEVLVLDCVLMRKSSMLRS